MDVEIRTIAEGEFEECLRSLELSFSGSITPEDVARERLIAETDRCIAAFRQLHRAGRVDEPRVGGLERMDALFASDPAPWSSVSF